MIPITVPATQVRLPAEAREAIARHQPVTVVSHDRPSFVLVHPGDFALVSSILERWSVGLPVPIDDLLTDDDLEVLALEKQADEDLATGILETWT